MAAGSLCRLGAYSGVVVALHINPCEGPTLASPQQHRSLSYRELNLNRVVGCGQQSDLVGALLFGGQETGESNLSFTGDVSLPFPPSLKCISKVTLEKTTGS